MKRLIVHAVLAAAALCASAASAGEFYVATNGVDAVGRGSEEYPFETIQYAIDSVEAGSTIWVKPGIYDKGGEENTNVTAHLNRVVLKKKVYLKSTGGATVTHIVGAPDPDTGGVGPKAVRCILSPRNSAGNASLGLESQISGFTIRDGYGDDGSTGHEHRSGGFLQYYGDKKVYISDCVISNCASYSYGGARGGTFARCLFANNRVTKNHGTTNPAGVAQANLISCILTGNGDSTYDCAAGVSCTLVNCTVVCNRGYGVSQDSSPYNSVVCWNSYSNYGGTKGAANVIGGSPLVSLIDDWRVIEGGAADGAGDASHLTVFTSVGDMAQKDFFGRGIDASAVHAGAVQTATAVKGGTLCVAGPFSCGGTMVPEGASAYMRSEDGLGQWRVAFPEMKIEGSATNHLCCVSRTYGGGSQVLWPDMKNEVVMVAPMAQTLSTTNTPEYCKALWVAPGCTGDGSETNPFGTIQEAVESGGGGTVVFLAPGNYASGGVVASADDVQPNGNCRVWIRNEKVRIVGVAGAGRTIIAGEADPSSGGFGNGAFRCVGAADSVGNALVQGVTLSNGWTRAASAATLWSKRGAAARKVCLADCVVTDCHGQENVFYSARLYRCKVSGNECFDDSLFNGGRIVCSWIGPNSSRDSSAYYGYLGTGTTAWFSTILVDNGQSAFSQGADVYNCIAVGGRYVKAAMKSRGNLFWRFSEVDSAAAGTFTDASPRFAGDRIHLKHTSPALTAGVSPSEEAYSADDAISVNWPQYASTDIDGAVVAMRRDGTATAGASQVPVFWSPGFQVIVK